MTVEFRLNGQSVQCPAGISLAAALFYLEQPVLRRTAGDGAARSLLCGMGVCFDCVVRVDGQSGVRACQQLVAAGMTVETQVGHARLPGSHLGQP